MKIETIDINHTAYLNLVKQYGGIFHQPEWLKLFDDEQMRIAGILIMIIKLSEHFTLVYQKIILQTS